MQILQPYNNNTLQLMSSDEAYVLSDFNSEIHVVKLSLFNEVNTFQVSVDLEEGRDFYVKENELFLKPNEYLDRSGYSVIVIWL